jgi:microcystin-dependent protein
VLFYDLVKSLVNDDGTWKSQVATGDFIFSAVNTGDTPDRLLCDGSAKSKTTYADLYAAIGDVYATTNGQAAPAAGNFRVPDCRARFPVGIGSFPSALSVSLGSEGGEEKHLLSLAEGAMDTAHTHTTGRMRGETSVFADDVYLLTGSSTKTGSARCVTGDNQSNIVGDLSAHTGAYVITSDANTLLDPATIAAHGNIPPYFGAYVFIKT